MSNSPNTDLDLNQLFLPDWAKGSSDTQLYKKYTGEEGLERNRRDRPRGRRDGPGGGRPGQRGPQRGGGGPREGGARDGQQRGRGGPQRGGPRGSDRGQDRGGRGQRFDRRGPRPEPKPLPEVDVYFMADEAGAETLARQIKATGRAFPLFNIAQMVLGRPERHVVQLKIKKGKDGAAVQKLFVCALDDSLWLSDKEAGEHALNAFFDTFYETVKTEAEPPKGTYTFVARCGITGRLLGPPNYHDYQNQLRSLYNERFQNRMSFDAFKSRVEIVREEETVKQWLDEQSFTTTYNCLNLPEPLTLESREAVREHFEKNHLANIVREVAEYRIEGKAAVKPPCREIGRLIRRNFDDQKRFPLKTVHKLSEQFAGRGLQFFKADKSITYVAVARPRTLTLDSGKVSPGIREIIDFIKANEGCHRKKLIETLAPAPEPATPEPVAEAAPAPVSEPAEAPASDPVSEAHATPPATEESSEAPAEAVDSSAEGAEAPAATPEAPAPAPEASAPAPNAEPAQPAEPELTGKQKAVIGDLHWLIHQGHVIEFASGVLRTADVIISNRPKRKSDGKKGGAKGKGGESKGQSTPAPAAQGEAKGTAAASGDAPAPEGQAPSTPEAAPAPTSAPEPAPSAEAATPASEPTVADAASTATTAESPEAASEPVVEPEPQAKESTPQAPASPEPAEAKVEAPASADAAVETQAPAAEAPAPTPEAEAQGGETVESPKPDA